LRHAQTVSIFRRDALWWWTCLAFICALLLAPLLLIELPPLVDYPNHLARAFLLADDGRDPVLAAIARRHWILTPNLALDAILPWLIDVLPVHIAGRILIGLFVLIPVLGSIAYSSALFGRRGWWSLAVGLAAYNATMLMGFLNFMVSIGMAFFVAAIWERWRETAPRRAVAAVAAGMTLVFFCHLMGLLFATGLIGAYELERMVRRREVWRRLPALAAILAVPIALYALSAFNDATFVTKWIDATAKLSQLQVAFANYDRVLDIATGALVVGFPALCIATGHARVPMRAWLAMAGLTALYIVAPLEFKGTGYVDERLIVMLAFMVFATVWPVLPRRLALVAGVTFGLLLSFRMLVLADSWHGYAENLAEFRAVVADLPADSRVFVARIKAGEAPEYWSGVAYPRLLSNGNPTDGHMAALVLIEHRAFWPGLFNDPGQQPILLRPYFHALANQGTERGHTYQDFAGTDQLGTCGYDHLLLLNAGGQSNLANFAAKRIALLRSNDYVALYRIRTPNPDCL
jgi:hypothetical protein